MIKSVAASSQNRIAVSVPFLKRGVFILRIGVTALLTLAGIWSCAVMTVVWKLSASTAALLAAALFVLWLGSFRRNGCLFMLAVIEAAFMIWFAGQSAERHFAGVEFERVFAVKPSVNYLPDGKFEVVNLRNNRYPDDYSEKAPYDDVFINSVFDPADVAAVQLAQVYWGGMELVAHTMLNFRFADGRNLSVSVEPRTPVGVDRKHFTHLCHQHELLFVLSVPEDVFELRSRIRGENLYLYDLNFTPDESRKLLTGIIGRVAQLDEKPEFYDLLQDNCITALLPALKSAKPELHCDFRVIFNGWLDRMLFEQGMLKQRDNESFESLRSRCFVGGKSQGEL
ncbi:MAG: DUF4105 domain-containing protein [Lentisphaerae bacterium]|nr:DUF4105 domain-containing protein [Lentisphaerota bacterium]MBE6389145.1 DUF4105 domain-containing protein [Lentisphaerota bacterium]